MTIHLPEFTKKFFQTTPESLSEHEKHVVKHFAERTHVSRNINKEFDQKLSLGQRVADKVAAFGGSWTFIIIFGAVLLIWVTVNTLLAANRGKAFDPYPFILLNLLLSMIAAIQAPVIMMSQNRQAAKDRLDAAHDYEVNLKSEMEIFSLHEKIDEIREKKWEDLVRMQQEQIELLQNLLKERDGRSS